MVSNREIASINAPTNVITQCRVELDSHADTCGVNQVAKILEFHGQVAQVSGFADSMTPMKDVPIVKAALAYDLPDSGETIILIINQALYFGDELSHILLNPNQMRSFNVKVEDVPRHLLQESSHSIMVEAANLTIPLKLHGIISYFNARTPTLFELENCQQIELTSANEWNPHSSHFAEVEGEINNHMTLSALNVECMEQSDHLFLHAINKERLSSIKLDKKNLFIQEQTLATNWGIGLNEAVKTLKATTQNFIRSALHPIERRFRTKNVSLRYNHLKCRFYSDTFFSGTKSIPQNTCAQLFVTDFGYAKVTPIRTKAEAGFALKELIQDVGIPKDLHTDGAKELTMGNWKQVCQESGIKTSITEKNSPWQNRAEVEIRELKRHVRRLMTRSATPLTLWDFCCQYVVELRNRIARPLPQLHGRTPYELLTGNTPDVSEFLEFHWFQLVWYYEPSVFPEQNRLIAKWLGVAHRVGQAMCFWILPISGVPIARTTIQAISKEELTSVEVQCMITSYERAIEETLGDNTDDSLTFQLYREDEIDQDDFEQDLVEPDAAAAVIDEIEADAFDELLLVEPVLQRDGQMLRARITGCKRDNNGNPIGCYNPNPILNSRIYLAEFPDGHIQELSANSIVEAIYNQVDDDGFDEQFFHDIIGHRYNTKLLSQEELERIQYLRENPGQGKRFCTLKGWEICISWNDGTTSWHTL